MPGGNATIGSLSSNLFSVTTNYGLRAREELNINSALTAVAGVGWETTDLKGINTAYSYAGVAGVPSTVITAANREFQNTAPELALLYSLNQDWLLHARVATGYGTPQVSNLFVLPSGFSGNNTGLQTQKNLGYDVGFDWTQRASTSSFRTSL
jgi:iron complex outermembrane receptor protein